MSPLNHALTASHSTQKTLGHKMGLVGLELGHVSNKETSEPVLRTLSALCPLKEVKLPH